MKSETAAIWLPLDLKYNVSNFIVEKGQHKQGRQIKHFFSFCVLVGWLVYLFGLGFFVVSFWVVFWGFVFEVKGKLDYE